MFTKEASGLALLKNANAFKIPEVISVGEIKGTAYMILEYIKGGDKRVDFWKLFGQKLAKQHLITQSVFGLTEDNFIGSLPQYNSTETTNAPIFYIENRLKPQFQIAAYNGFRFPNIDTFYKNISNEIPDEPPALIHGDLWSGNYLVTSEGTPCLIDPAVAFAPREMDVAMMHLFGVFSDELFTVYNDSFPLQNGWKERLPIWQLYYLLVHLNLFGRSYLPSVTQIINRYS